MYVPRRPLENYINRTSTYLPPLGIQFFRALNLTFPFIALPCPFVNLTLLIIYSFCSLFYFEDEVLRMLIFN